MPAPEGLHTDHAALLYESDGEFVDRAAPFAAGGLERGLAIAVLGRRNSGNLREALGDSADFVSFVAREDVYKRPIDALANYASTLRHHHAAGTPVAVVGEISFGPEPEQWHEWLAYEWALNHVFAPYDVSILCAYDAVESPAAVLDGVKATHPRLNDPGAGNVAYDHSSDAVRAFMPIPQPLPELRSCPPGSSPEELREILAAELVADGVPESRALDFLLAANEVAVNAWQHAGGALELRAGRFGGDFACEIVDAGPGLDDPLAGFVPPDPARGQGAGLWIARRLSRRLELLDSGHGLTVRLWA